MTGMEREIFIPKTTDEWLAKRATVLTSTEIGALYGESPYATLLETWLRKKNKTVVELDMNERMEWGITLEPAIAHGVAKKLGLKLRKMEEFTSIPKHRIGTSGDYVIVGSGDIPEGIMEVKNVDGMEFKNKWLYDEDGNLEAPPHIEFQAQYQLLVTGHKYLLIAALVGGNRIEVLRREPDQEVFKSIMERTAVFWASVDANEQPAPEFPRDAALIARLHGYAEPGMLFDAKGNDEIEALVQESERLRLQEAAAKEARSVIKAMLLMKIGTAEKVLGHGWSITCGVIGPAEIPAHTRAGYRNFRLFMKKAK